MRPITPLMATVALALALSGPARAATVAVSAGPGSSAANMCTGDPAGSIKGDRFVKVDRVCSRPDIGFGHGHASASVGHLGVKADAATINHDSLGAGMGAEADYTDNLVFTHDGTGVDPDSAFADVSLNMFLDGVINAAQADSGFANASIEGYVAIGSGFYQFRRTILGDGREEGFNAFSGGVLGDPAGTILTTPTFRINFDTPILLAVHLQASAVSGFEFSSALSDFSGSFKFASGSVFNLPEGITVNAGDYLVNNRFIDPLAAPAAAPEPSAWALMILGFGLAGATLRRRCVPA